MRFPRLLAILLITATACSSTENSSPLPDAGTANGDPDAGLPAYTWWQDVQPIVAERCLLCHGAPPQFGAPHSMVTYLDTHAPARDRRALHVVMAERVNADRNRMPPSSQPQLTAEQREIIRIWSAIGAPEGTPPGADAGVPPQDASGVDATQQDANTPPVDGGTPRDGASSDEDASAPSDAEVGADAGAGDAGFGQRTFEILAHAPNSTNPYSLPLAETTYVCWSFTVPPTMAAEEHAIRFEPIIDNTAHLHHTLLFRNTGNAAREGPFDCGSWPLDWDLIAGWAPGRQAEDIPAGAGVRLEPGDQLVLQAHYASVASNQTDQSGMRVIVTEEPGLIDAGMVWSGVIWIQAINGANVTRSGTCTIGTPFTLFSVFPHMHQLGKRIKLEVRRSGQSNWTTLVDIDPWDFNDQPNVPIPLGEQQMSNGDQLRTTCIWDTGGRSVSFGEATTDEMCFNFMYHYPLISNQYLCVDTQL